MSKIYVGDIGTTITVSLGASVEDVDSTCYLNLKYPSGDTSIFEGVFSSYTNPAEVFYVVDSSDFFYSAGRYLLQAELVDSSGNRWLGETTSFQVYERWT